MDYAEWRNVLAERFPNYESPAHDPEWLRLKQRLAPGQTITGIVVARAHFGAWIDLGVGFPGLLEIICIADLSPERYRAGDWCPVGSEVSATIGNLIDDRHQIYLWQVRPWEKKSHN